MQTPAAAPPRSLLLVVAIELTVTADELIPAGRTTLDVAARNVILPPHRPPPQG